MNDAQRQREESLFEAATHLTDPAEREAFLDEACGDDPALRERLALLLEGYFEAEGFLSASPPHASSPAPDPLEAPLLLSGRYRLREKIGEGGFGEVWRAEQTEPVHRPVAVKILKLGMDTRQVVRRFETERQTLALMDHPHIARVLDAGATDAGRPYFVMDLVSGLRITDYADQHALPVAERLEVFLKVCEAIQHAHQKGIIHRDIKPSNILVSRLEGVPVPKVIDFGIAKAIQPVWTDRTVSLELPHFLGTPTYVSPEQAEGGGQDIDTRSDLYSLGVLLYELLVGRTPFEAQELTEGGLEALRRMIREREPLRPSARLKSLPCEELAATVWRRGTDAPRLIRRLAGDLDWIVMKCLEKDRTRRYATADALIRDLQRHLRDEPVGARPPRLLYRAGKYVRRNRALVAAVGGVALALVVGAALSLWQAAVAMRARGLAEEQLYAARMNLAQREWEQNNVARVGQLLEETAGYPDRGFEWYYWQRQTHRELLTLHIQGGWVSGVAFSPNGQRLVCGSVMYTASGGVDPTAKVWDLATGKLILTLVGSRSTIPSVAFSPDGQRILTGSHDATARIWDAHTGKELFALEGHRHGVARGCFSPDGQWIVTGSYDRTAKVWDAQTGEEHRTLQGHRDRVTTVTFSPDSQRIATGSWDQTVKVWDTHSGQEQLTIQGHPGPVRSVAFSSDGRRLLSASCETALLWDAFSGRQLMTLKGHQGEVRSAAFSPEGLWIVTAGMDRTAKLWDLTTGQELVTLKGHTAGIRSASL